MVRRCLKEKGFRSNSAFQIILLHFFFFFWHTLLIPPLIIVISREIVSSALSTDCAVCFIVFSRGQLWCFASDQISFIGPLGPKPQTSEEHFTYCLLHLVLFIYFLVKWHSLCLKLEWLSCSKHSDFSKVTKNYDST